MAPSWKNTPRATTTAASNAKSTVAGGAGPINTHPPHPNVLIEDIGEGQSSPPTILRTEANGHDTRQSVEGQLIQMLPNLQKQLDDQRSVAMCECEKVVLERDVSACVQNQLVTQIEILLKSQSARN